MKTLTSKYVLVLGILTVVILISQILMQKTIGSSETDARIINISGRQRMLSQKITKAALKLSNSSSEYTFNEAKAELAAATQLWSQSHIDLRYGSDELEVLEMNNSHTLNQLFQDIEPLFKIIKTAAEALVSVDYGDLQSSGSIADIEKHVGLIINNESDFLKLMNKITFQYDHLASAKIDNLSAIEYYLMGVTFLLILLEVFFIFRPVYRNVKEKEAVIGELNELMNSEKSFASDQISQANKTIQELRKLARQLKNELEEKQNEYAHTTTNQLTKYLKISSDYQELIKQNQSLKTELDSMKSGALVR